MVERLARIAEIEAMAPGAALLAMGSFAEAPFLDPAGFLAELDTEAG